MSKPELKFEMFGGKDTLDDRPDAYEDWIFLTAVRFKVGEVWLTLCSVNEKGDISLGPDLAAFERLYDEQK